MSNPPLKIFGKGRELELATLILNRKQLKYTVIKKLPEPLPLYIAGDLVLYEREYPIVGIQAIIRFLDGRYPDPQLFHPDHKKAAIQLSIATKLIEGYYDTKRVAEVSKLFPEIPTSPVLDSVSIIDLALLPLVKNDPEWGAYVNSIN